jgi:hypothetical protein
VAASGDVVTFVDADDLIAPNALELVANAFAADAALDCLFVNVGPFGDLAAGTQANQTRAVRKILSRLGTRPGGDHRMPCSAGRTFRDPARRSADGFSARGDQALRASQSGSLRRERIRRFEFYFRVALRCRCALLAAHVYRPRCSGQSLFARTESRARLLDASVRIRAGLLDLPEVSKRADLRRSVRRSLADAHFERAYFAHQAGSGIPVERFCRIVRDRHRLASRQPIRQSTDDSDFGRSRAAAGK